MAGKGEEDPSQSAKADQAAEMAWANQRADRKDPMVCPKCECYYEYKGEVCLEEGQLVVKYAACTNTQAVLERMIKDLTGIEETKASEEKETQASKPKAASVQGSHQISVFDVLAERRHTA
jgi:hypothetical protein